MWHGGGITGAIWETTPDARIGWQMFFLRAGFNTYISDAVERGRWDCNAELTQSAYDSLVEDMKSGVIVLTHSQSGNFGFIAAGKAPGRVRAVISVEPAGAPDPQVLEARKLKDVPSLFLWGDYLNQHSFWSASRPASERWRDALKAAGCDVTWIDLPSLESEVQATP